MQFLRRIQPRNVYSDIHNKRQFHDYHVQPPLAYVHIAKLGKVLPKYNFNQNTIIN